MADTLADIQKMYGDSVYPLYKDTLYEPYMGNPKVKDVLTEEYNTAIEVYHKTHNVLDTERITGVRHEKITELVNSGYKPQPVKFRSFGYQGVVLYNKDEDKVQCSECGQWFKKIGFHVVKKHNMSVNDYKDKHGLCRGVPLQSEQVSRKQSITAIKSNCGRNLPKLRRVLSKAHQVEAGKSNSKTYIKNKNNLCDEQILARFEVVKHIVKKDTLDSSDIYHYDRKLYKTLHYRFGSIKKACSHYGINSVGCKKCVDIDIISEMRNYVFQNQKMPRPTKDLSVSASTIRSHFGSWRRAKMMAGLDQLLQEVK
jgi:hypothetical protein